MITTWKNKLIRLNRKFYAFLNEEDLSNGTSFVSGFPTGDTSASFKSYRDIISDYVPIAFVCVESDCTVKGQQIPSGRGEIVSSRWNPPAKPLTSRTCGAER